MKMATALGGMPEDSRRTALSPRPRGRESTKDTLCRNVTIYGHCRYEDKGCVFSHEQVKVTAPQPESLHKRLNVNSPSFQPTSLAPNGSSVLSKSTGLSPKAASAAPFKPRGSTPAPTAPIFTPSIKRYNPIAPDWVNPDVPEVLPPYGNASASDNNYDTSHINPFDNYGTPTPSLPSTSHTPQPLLNPYAQEANPIGTATYYQGTNSYVQPLQYHLYANLGPHRDLRSNERTASNLFISEDLRQTLQKRTDATFMTFPNSTLPPNVAHYHSLVPLVFSTQKTAALFGYATWVFKAESSEDGRLYCLRRLPGYHLTNDQPTEVAIRSVQQNWSKIRNGNVVSIHLAFTSSAFGDSSLIFVSDYHPASETLEQKHFTPTTQFGNRSTTVQASEQVLWSYMVQIANALKAIHSAGLAARVIDPSKVILTGENRIRLNGCAILDVVQHDTPHSINDLQRLDLHQFGRLMVTLATNNNTKSTDTYNRSYTPHFRDRVTWLLDHSSGDKIESIETFLSSIAGEMATVFDASLHSDDQLQGDLARELENSRVIRLLTKLNFLNERPEYEQDRSWAETGNRYILQLFRDYVFHQVNAQEKPVLDMGHVLACLNKVDVGVEEKICLTARDENTVLVVTYREVRSAIESAFGELVRRAAA